MSSLRLIFLFFALFQINHLYSQRETGSAVNFGVSGSQNNLSGLITIEYVKEGKDKFGMRFAYGKYYRDNDKSVFDSISQHFDFGLDFAHRIVTAKRVQPYLGPIQESASIRKLSSDANYGIA